MAGARMAEVVPAGGKVVAFNHGPGQLNVQARIAGFTSKATEMGLEVLPEKTLDMSAEEGTRLMEDLLVSEPDIAGVFTVGTPPAIGAVSALKAAGNTTCVVIAFDPDGETYKLVQEEDPILKGIVVQDPYFMGFEGMNQLFYYLTGETDKIVKNIDSPITVLTPENAADYADNPQIVLN
jgi:ribose transport system substrate-binding protein